MGMRFWVVDIELDVMIGDFVEAVLTLAYETEELPCEIVVLKLLDDVEVLEVWFFD